MSSDFRAFFLALIWCHQGQQKVQLIRQKTNPLFLENTPIRPEKIACEQIILFCISDFSLNTVLYSFLTLIKPNRSSSFPDMKKKWDACEKFVLLLWSIWWVFADPPEKSPTGQWARWWRMPCLPCSCHRRRGRRPGSDAHLRLPEITKSEYSMLHTLGTNACSNSPARPAAIPLIPPQSKTLCCVASRGSSERRGCHAGCCRGRPVKKIIVFRYFFIFFFFCQTTCSVTI